MERPILGGTGTKKCLNRSFRIGRGEIFLCEEKKASMRRITFKISGHCCS